MQCSMLIMKSICSPSTMKKKRKVPPSKLREVNVAKIQDDRSPHQQRDIRHASP